MRKTIVLFVYLCACVLMVQAQKKYFMQVPLRQGYRAAYDELIADGYTFQRQRENIFVFRGKFDNHRVDLALAVDKDSMITELQYEFDEEDLIYAQLHYEHLEPALTERYGQPVPKAPKEEPKSSGNSAMDYLRRSAQRQQDVYVRSTSWKVPGGTVTLELDYLDVRLGFVVDLAYSKKSNGVLDFFKQDMNMSMRDYCYRIQEMGYTMEGETDGAILYKGTVSNVDNVDVIIYGTPDQKHVASVSLQYPAGKHWAGDSDYEAMRDVFVQAYGSPQLEENNPTKQQAIWKFTDILLAVASENNAITLMLINYAAWEEVQAADESAAKQPSDGGEEEMDENSELYCQAMLKVATEEWEKSGRTDRDFLLMMTAYAEKLGGIYSGKGWYTTAVTYYKKTIEYAALLSGKNSTDYLSNVYNLSIVYSDMGDMENAGKCIEEILALSPSTTFEKPSRYFLFLRAAMLFYETVGRYDEAEAMFGRVMNELPRLTGEEYNKMLIMFMHDRSTLAMHMGNGKEAKDWLDREGQVLPKVYAEPHDQYALWYSGYGVLYLNDKKYAEAEKMLSRALTNLVGIGEREKQLYLAAIYSNLSIAYAYEGKADSAISVAQKSAEAYKEIYTTNHPKYANALTNLAFAYSKKKEYQQSLQYCQEAAKIYESILGPEHLTMMSVLYSEAAYNGDLANDDEAERLFRRSIAVAKKNYQKALDYMSEFQREQFWQSCSELLEREEMTRFIYENYSTRSSIREFAYDNELFSKGLLLASTDMVRRSIQESGDNTLISKYEQLSQLKERIYRMEEAGNESHELDSCRQVADALEKEVTRQSAAFRQNEEIWRVGWQDVCRALRDKQVAIEFTRIPLNEDSVIYAALLLRSNDAHPRMLPLFEEKEVVNILQTTDPDTQYDFQRGGWLLFKPVWSKILPYLHYGDTIYCAATGILHQIAIESLPFSADQTISSMFHVERVSSTRELVHRTTATSRSTAALYGGIYYDLEMDELMAQSESYSNVTVATTRAVVDETLRAGVHYLPGTKKEVDTINAILRPNHIDTRVYTSSAANEESFKALSGRHTNILHIATHGFYWTDSTAREQRYFAQRSAMPGEKALTIDPLTRSGLLFAGANIALRGHSKELPQNVQDGILTSKEISLLDLRGADMVILSACETGKGEITGEGVFGLQRAFKMAGAQTILMSLWPVDDAATQMMTTEFYRHWIDRHESKREAFLHAQERVRKQYPQPKYWAAFILLD